METGTAEEIFYEPCHPYTWGLLRALPAWAKDGEPLYTIPGIPPPLITARSTVLRPRRKQWVRFWTSRRISFMRPTSYRRFDFRRAGIPKRLSSSAA